MRRWALLAAALVASCGEAAEPRVDRARPELHLLTALPLLWSEQFGLDQPGSPVVERLERAYRVKAIDLPSQLPERGLLLAVQPRALPAEELVALDAWVRRGGRLVLLVDPMLEWPSELALGDRRRPPIAYPDTGLLKHWGLRLDAPDERGPERRGGGHFPLVFISAGNLASDSPNCSLFRAGITAECQIGNGSATVVADADWLNEELVTAHEGYLSNHADELLELLSSVRSGR